MNHTYPDTTPVIATVQSWLLKGVPWSLEGRTPKDGVDCYHIAVCIFGLLGITLPDQAEEAQALFVRIQPPYQPFDALLMGGGRNVEPRHFGILMDRHWGYHTTPQTNGLAQFRLDRGPWRRMIKSAWRYREWAA